MQKLIAIFGAGRGLGMSVARRFGREGFAVALVARKPALLETMAAELARDGITALPFPADLTQGSAIKPLIEQIREKMGHLDVVYYAPSTAASFTSAVDLKPEPMRPVMELSFFSLISVVQEVLPAMRARKAGAILGAVGGNAAEGRAHMSGSGPAHAAARNFFFSLHGEVADDGVRVGLLTIGGIIKNSEFHQEMEDGTKTPHKELAASLVDPDDMAETLWKVASGKGDIETFFAVQ